MYDHLPPPPEGYQYLLRSFKNEDYTTTGWYHPNDASTATKAKCAGVATLFFDFDLCDWLSAGDLKTVKKMLYKSTDDNLDEILQDYIIEVRKVLNKALGHDPTYLVCSGYGLHAYYWITDTTDVGKLQLLNRALVKRINITAEDPKFADPLVVNPGERLTRAPGSINRKSSIGRQVRIILGDDQHVFTHSELSALIKPKKSVLSGVDEINLPTKVDWDSITMVDHDNVTLGELARNLDPGGKLKLKCPFHNGSNSMSAFLKYDASGQPFLRCESEKITYRPIVWTTTKAPVNVVNNLKTGKGGQITKTLLNIQTIIRHDERVGLIWYNERLREITVTKNKEGPFKNSKALDDMDVLFLKDWLAHNYDFEPSISLLHEALTVEAGQNLKNPLKEWLNDAAAEVTTEDFELLSVWLSKTLQMPNTPLMRAYSKRFLISAIARAYNPGCRVDTVLTIVGKQGAGKSSMFQALTPEGHFSDTHLDLSNKDSYAQLSRAWIYEISELSAFSKREHEQVKAWITSREDVYREPYGRLVKRHPRQTILVATTNDDTPLTDSTGSRRFWVLKAMGEIDREWVTKNRRKLWGAAALAYKRNEQWWLTDNEEKLRVELSKDFEPENTIASTIKLHLHTLQPIFEINEVFERIGIKPTDQRRYLRTVTASLEEIGAARLARRQISGRRVGRWLSPRAECPKSETFLNEIEEARHDEMKIVYLAKAKARG